MDVHYIILICGCCTSNISSGEIFLEKGGSLDSMTFIAHITSSVHKHKQNILLCQWCFIKHYCQMVYTQFNTVPNLGCDITYVFGMPRISPMQLWTSFCSTLMVVPPVTIVVQLFKKAKTKKQEEYDDKVKRRRAKALQKIKSKWLSSSMDTFKSLGKARICNAYILALVCSVKFTLRPLLINRFRDWRCQLCAEAIHMWNRACSAYAV